MLEGRSIMARGKYAHVIDKLPKVLGVDPTNQDKIDAVARAISEEPGFTRHGSYLAELYTDIRFEKDAAKQILSEIQLRLDAVEQMLVDQYEVEGTTSVHLVTGESVSVQYEPYAQVTDREAFRLWCLANGLERSMVLHPSTTQSLIKERLLEGEPEPAGINVVAQAKLVLRK